MSADSTVPLGRRITDVLGFTDSPRTQAKIFENSTPTEFLIRAVVLTVCVVLFTISILVTPDKGFFWFLLADFCLAYPAAIMWVRWRKYRKIWPDPPESSDR
jgi:hypothetical protein